MQELFPRPPVAEAALRRTVPACEWVMPADMLPARARVGLCKALPPGMPDCLQVELRVDRTSIERTTAVVYGRHSYLIHYEFHLR